MRSLPAVLSTLAVATSLVAPRVARADKFHYVAGDQPRGELSAAVKPPPKQDVAAARPTISGDAMLDIQNLLGGVHAEQEQILIGLIASAPDSDPQKADYFARLGELYAKQQRTARLLAAQAEIAAQHESDARAKAKLAATATAQHDAAHAALVSAVKTYRALIASPTSTTYAKMDVALFSLAYTLRTGTYPSEARKVYERLIADYPASRYVVEAWVALADDQFEAGNLAEAEMRYRKALAFPKASIYWYARYKLG